MSQQQPQSFEDHWQRISADIKSEADADPIRRLTTAERAVHEAQQNIFGGFVRTPRLMPDGIRDSNRAPFDHPLVNDFTLLAANYRSPWVKDARNSTFIVHASKLESRLLADEESPSDKQLSMLFSHMLRTYLEFFDRDLTFNESLLDVLERERRSPRPRIRQQPQTAEDAPLSDYTIVWVDLAASKRSSPQGIAIETKTAGSIRVLRIRLARRVAQCLTTFDGGDLALIFRNTVWGIVRELQPNELRSPPDVASAAVSELADFRDEFKQAVQRAEEFVTDEVACRAAHLFFPDMGSHTGVPVLLRMIQGMLCHVGWLGRHIITVVAPPSSESGFTTRSSVTAICNQFRKGMNPIDDPTCWAALANPYTGADGLFAKMVPIVRSAKDYRDVQEVRLGTLKRPMRHWMPYSVRASIRTFRPRLEDDRGNGSFLNWFAVQNVLALACDLAGTTHEGSDLSYSWVLGPSAILKRIEQTISIEEQDFWTHDRNLRRASLPADGEWPDGFGVAYEDALKEAKARYEAHCSIFQLPRVAAYVDTMNTFDGLGLTRIVRLPAADEYLCRRLGMTHGRWSDYAYASTGFAVSNEEIRNDVWTVVAAPPGIVRLFVTGHEVARWNRSDGWGLSPMVADAIRAEGSPKPKLQRILTAAWAQKDKQDQMHTLAVRVAAILFQVSEERGVGALSVFLPNEVVEAVERDGQALWDELLPEDVIMNWAQPRPLQRFSDAMLWALMVMDGAIVFSSDGPDVSVTGRLQLASGKMPPVDRAKRREMWGFGTRHRSALGFITSLKAFFKNRGEVAAAITVSADGPMRCFPTNKPVWFRVDSE